MGGSDGVVDLRSDTVTRPTAEMYAAMGSCGLGDDVMGDDETVLELEAVGAEMLGKEAAMFVPSGTMSNLIAAMEHSRGVFSPEVILGDLQHMYRYEGGNLARVGNVHAWVLPNEADGTLDIDAIKEAVRDDDVHYPKTTMVVLENTHNSCGGVPLPSDYVDRVGTFTKSTGLKLHIDGARIFNAATALDVPASRLCKAADSVSVCLSKGLGSPVGSLLIGDKEFIHGARYIRKALGGGMRQAGILAACGLVSLRTMTKRLGEDHANAKQLANGLADIPGIALDPDSVKSNIVFFDVESGRADPLIEKLKQEHNVLLGAYGTKLVRAVLHNDVPRQSISGVIDSVKRALAEVNK